MITTTIKTNACGGSEQPLSSNKALNEILEQLKLQNGIQNGGK